MSTLCEIIFHLNFQDPKISAGHGFLSSPTKVILYRTSVYTRI